MAVRLVAVVALLAVVGCARASGDDAEVSAALNTLCQEVDGVRLSVHAATQSLLTTYVEHEDEGADAHAGHEEEGADAHAGHDHDRRLLAWGSDDDDHSGHDHSGQDDHGDDQSGNVTGVSSTTLAALEAEFSEACTNIGNGETADEAYEEQLAATLAAAFQEHEAHAAGGADGNDTETLKGVFAAVIFFESLIGAILPVVFERMASAKMIVSLAHSFSGGVFLAVGLVHLVPHAIEQQYVAYADSNITSEYPTALVIVMVGMLLVLFVEKVIFHVHHHDPDAGVKKFHEEKAELVSKGTMAEMWERLHESLVTLLALSVHSVLAGITLGLADTESGTRDVFFAIAAHKGTAALALGIKFVREGAKPVEMAVALACFSVVTPLGILIGWSVENADPWTILVLDALCAGTFLYIGASETTSSVLEMHDEDCSDDHTIPSDAEHGHSHDHHGHDHHHVTHGAAPRPVRMARFGMMLIGVTAVSLAQLAHPEHADDGADPHAGHGHK